MFIICHCAGLHITSTTLHRTTQHHKVPRSTTQHHAAPRSTTQHHTTSLCITSLFSPTPHHYSRKIQALPALKVPKCPSPLNWTQTALVPSFTLDSGSGQPAQQTYPSLKKLKQRNKNISKTLTSPKTSSRLL